MNSGTAGLTQTFQAPDYDLAATLNSGQAFRWQADGNGWVGIIEGRWVRLESDAGNGAVTAQTAILVTDWAWLVNYLQLDLSLEPIR